MKVVLLLLTTVLLGLGIFLTAMAAQPDEQPIAAILGGACLGIYSAIIFIRTDRGNA